MVMPNKVVEAKVAAGAGTEEGRRPTVVPAPAATNPELSDRPKRRTFTAGEKLRILEETDRAADTGEIGAILRREGLYSSTLTDWRRQRDAGAFEALTPVEARPEGRPPSTRWRPSWRRPAGRTPGSSSGSSSAEAIIDLQKKVASLLGIPLATIRQRRRAVMEAVLAACRRRPHRRRLRRPGRVARHCLSPPRASGRAAGRPAPSSPRPPRALTPEERQTVLDLLREPRFADLAPAEVYATLLDEGVYHCSIRTMYRILDDHAEVRERRDQLRHPVYSQTRTAGRRSQSGLVVGHHKADGTREMDLRSVMLMPSLVCLLGAVDAINRASLQFREAGEGVVGVREQEAVGGRIADDGDCPVADAPFNPIA